MRQRLVCKSAAEQFDCDCTGENGGHSVHDLRDRDSTGKREKWVDESIGDRMTAGPAGTGKASIAYVTSLAC